MLHVQPLWVGEGVGVGVAWADVAGAAAVVAGVLSGRGDLPGPHRGQRVGNPVVGQRRLRRCARYVETPVSAKSGKR